jgi:hypothetical protein
MEDKATSIVPAAKEEAQHVDRLRVTGLGATGGCAYLVSPLSAWKTSTTSGMEAYRALGIVGERWPACFVLLCLSGP